MFELEKLKNVERQDFLHESSNDVEIGVPRCARMKEVEWKIIHHRPGNCC